MVTTPAHPRTILLANVFREVRQHHTGKIGAIHPTTERQLDTVRKWLDQNAEMPESFLRGYVDYVFKKYRPKIPHAGQLHNKKLLAEYCNGGGSTRTARMTREDRDKVNNLYAKITRPETGQTLGYDPHILTPPDPPPQPLDVLAAIDLDLDLLADQNVLSIYH